MVFFRAIFSWGQAPFCREIIHTVFRRMLSLFLKCCTLHASHQNCIFSLNDFIFHTVQLYPFRFFARAESLKFLSILKRISG